MKSGISRKWQRCNVMGRPPVGRWVTNAIARRDVTVDCVTTATHLHTGLNMNNDRVIAISRPKKVAMKKRKRKKKKKMKKKKKKKKLRTFKMAEEEEEVAGRGGGITRSLSIDIWKVESGHSLCLFLDDVLNLLFLLLLLLLTFLTSFTCNSCYWALLWLRHIHLSLQLALDAQWIWQHRNCFASTPTSPISWIAEIWQRCSSFASTQPPPLISINPATLQLICINSTSPLHWIGQFGNAEIHLHLLSPPHWFQSIRQHCSSFA